jgi:hypothetical protein
MSLALQSWPHTVIYDPDAVAELRRGPRAMPISS